MKKAVFTIVARNYTGLAGVLEKSVTENTDADFFTFIADEPGDAMKTTELAENILWAKDKLEIPGKLWDQLAFKYNLVEFCTAIKPFCIEYLFHKLGYEKVIYLDPDIYVFSSLEGVFDSLGRYSMVVTPHITEMTPGVESDHPQYLFLVNGTFNLGFAAIKNDQFGNEIVGWWKRVLRDDCFFDSDRGTATDQKWISLLPSFLPEGVLYIDRNKGLNAAPWNFHERKIAVKDQSFFVAVRSGNISSAEWPLVFVHFSGYDYSSLGEQRIVHKNDALNRFEDFDLVFRTYATALASSQFSRYSNLGYAYNTFENGKNILGLHRRLFRRMLDENKEFEKPFSTGPGSFYDLLKRKKLVDHATGQADKVTGKTIAGFDKKLGKVNIAAGMLKRVLGVRRYSMMIRFLRRYFKEENQAFLLDKEAGKKLWK